MEESPAFHLFPLLPSELRLKIWTIALCTPRVVTIACRKAPFHPRTPEIPRTIEWFSSNPPVPPLMHACSESRHEALPFYTANLFTPSSCIFLSFSFDIVRFPDHVLANVPPAALQHIQELILEVNDCAYFEHFNMEYIQQMTALKNVEIVACKGVPHSWGGEDWYLQQLLMGFETAREAHKAWACPRVTVFDKDTLEQVGYIEGGPKVPGWTEEEELE
jgi:hypothetical protein